MSVEALAVVLHHSRARGTDKVILLGIANHAGDGGAWPSLDTLARYANVDERNVRRSIRRLESAGELEVRVQAGGSSGVPAWRRPNRYDVLIACPATCDRTPNHRPIPLPTAPADLWTERGAPAPSPDASALPPGAPASPHPGAPASPEPSLEPSLNPSVSQEPQLQTARRCAVCLLPEAECRRRVVTSGHEFTPDNNGRHHDAGDSRTETHDNSSNEED